MPTVTYIAFDGRRFVTDVASGRSVMEGAVNADIPGIDADCGGSCACATCHVHVDEAWLDATGALSEMERAMLDFVPAARDDSRLSCQIVVTEALDGLVVQMPESQRS